MNATNTFRGQIWDRFRWIYLVFTIIGLLAALQVLFDFSRIELLVVLSLITSLLLILVVWSGFEDILKRLKNL